MRSHGRAPYFGHGSTSSNASASIGGENTARYDVLVVHDVNSSVATLKCSDCCVNFIAKYATPKMCAEVDKVNIREHPKHPSLLIS